MKQQMKAIIIALLMMSLSSTLVYAAPSHITDLTAQVQQVYDLVSANSESLIRIEAKIDGIVEPIDYSAQLTVIQDLIEGLPVPVDYSAQLTGIQEDLDDLSDSTSNNMQMESSSDYAMFDTPSPYEDSHVLYSSDYYPDGALFHVTLTGTIHGTTGDVGVHAYFPHPSGTVSCQMNDRLSSSASVDVDPVVVEFAAQKCNIIAHVAEGGTYHAFYTVIVTHIP